MSNDPEWDARAREAWQRTADRWDPKTLTLRPVASQTSNQQVANAGDR